MAVRSFLIIFNVFFSLDKFKPQPLSLQLVLNINKNKSTYDRFWGYLILQKSMALQNFDWSASLVRSVLIKSSGNFLTQSISMVWQINAKVIQMFKSADLVFRCIKIGNCWVGPQIFLSIDRFPLKWQFMKKNLTECFQLYVCLSFRVYVC